MEKSYSCTHTMWEGEGDSLWEVIYRKASTFSKNKGMDLSLWYIFPLFLIGVLYHPLTPKLGNVCVCVQPPPNSTHFPPTFFLPS